MGMCTQKPRFGNGKVCRPTKFTSAVGILLLLPLVFVSAIIIFMMFLMLVMLII